MLTSSPAQDEIDSTGIESRCLDLKGISACISLIADAQVYGPHQYGDFLADALYFLSNQVGRIEGEIVDLAHPGSKERRESEDPTAKEGDAS
jgi:hypothetical protein